MSADHGRALCRPRTARRSHQRRAKSASALVAERPRGAALADPGLGPVAELCRRRRFLYRRTAHRRAATVLWSPAQVRRLFSLWRRTPLQNAVIVGPKRSGKTSLLHYLRQILRAKNLRRISAPGARPDALSIPLHRLSRSAHGDEEGFLSQVLYGLGLPVPSPCTLERVIPILSDSPSPPPPPPRFNLSVAPIAMPISTPFLGGLRALAINQVGQPRLRPRQCAHPHELAARHASAGSPFFNIFGYSATRWGRLAMPRRAGCWRAVAVFGGRYRLDSPRERRLGRSSCRSWPANAC